MNSNMYFHFFTFFSLCPGKSLNANSLRLVRLLHVKYCMCGGKQLDRWSKGYERGFDGQN